MSQTLTIAVPLTIRRRGGRKVVLSPTGQVEAPNKPQIESTLVKALARAFRWQRMLESGSYATVAELAAAEKINPAYLGRILRLTLLPPWTVEAILDGQMVDTMLFDLMKRPSTNWIGEGNMAPKHNGR